MQTINKYGLLLFLVLFLAWPETVLSQKGIPTKVAVIPFEVFSAAGQSGMGQEFADLLSGKLSLNPYIYLSDSAEVRSVMGSVGKELNADTLQEMSRLLGVNFILFGSITRIGEHTSVDVQLYNNFPPKDYAKSYAEGMDTDQIIEALAGKVELAILDKSAFIPPSQRIEIQRAEKEPDDDFIFTLEGDMGETAVSKEPLPVAAAALTASESGPSESQQPPADQPAEAFGRKATAVEKSPAQTEVQVSETPLAATDMPEPVSSEPAEKKKKSKKRTFKIDSPVNINADSLEYDNSENRILFAGNVVARQGDIVMFADNMDVLYDPSGNLKRISAFGSVKVTQGERIAIGQSIVFYNQDQKIVVTGNPRVWQGDNVIQGRKITVFLKEDRSVVEGGPEARVNATIYPAKVKP